MRTARFFSEGTAAAPERRFGLAAAVAILGGLAIVLSSCTRNGTASSPATGANVISAHEFVLTDQNGKTRAELKVDKDGSPVLSFLDSKGKVSALLSVRANGTPILTFSGHITLALTSDGTPVLNMTDRQGRTAAAITVSYDGVPTLGLFDAGTKTSALLMADDTAGHLILTDPTTRALTHLP
jgi:hypothetical protein